MVFGDAADNSNDVRLILATDKVAIVIATATAIS